MADECTGVTTVEDLSIFCYWIEDGVPVEHFLEIVPLNSADAKTIHSALFEFLKENIQISKLVGMGLDRVANFSGNTAFQSLLKKNSTHDVFMHCHWHLLYVLQLACVQAAYNINGIKHAYVTLTSR